jgi:ribosome maturation factor RimP
VTVGALEEVRDLAEAVASHRSLILWDVEMTGRPGNAVVRVFVDGEGGVDLDTVASVSEEISRGLDLRDPIPGRYTLEVSSPGLERTLKSREHFWRSVGRRVVVKTREKLVPGTNRIDGTLVGASDHRVTVDTEEGAVEVPYEEIKFARTVFEWM